MSNANNLLHFLKIEVCNAINFTARQIPVHQARGVQDCQAIGQAVLWRLT